MLLGMTVRAAIYLRISRDPKADGLANDRQREDCETIARRNEWPVVQVYEDTASASQRNVQRLSYERMRRDFDAGKFNVLICWDLDRLTRQPRQLEDWIEAAEDGGLKLVTANGEADLSTDGGRMFARIKASVARQEIERKSARQRRKNEQLATDGLPAPGRRKYGWELDGITVRESEAAHLREASRRVLQGDSLRSIIRDLEQAGVPSPRGAQWTHVGLRAMLLRERMAGILVRRGQVQPFSRIQPILEMSEWEALRDLLTDPSRHTSRGKESAHWLTGILVCECGGSMSGKRVYGRGGSVTPSYVCRATMRAGYQGRHATIATSAAEPAGAAALYFALARLQNAHGEVAEVATARAALQSIDDQIARAEEAYSLTGSQSSLSLLTRLTAERQDASRTLGEAVGSLGSHRVLEAARSASPSGDPLNLDSLAAFTRTFAPLPPERKRNLARVSMRGHLRTGTGKGAKRIRWTTPDGEPLFAD